MNTRSCAITMAAALGIASPVMAANPQRSASDPGPASRDVTYAVSPESLFASGCTGGGTPWDPCPMCPIVAAPEFTGTITLTPRIHVPQGHRTYEVTIEDWLVTFYNHDEPTLVTGTGVFDRWTWIDGTSWQRMTLDLVIGDEEVPFSSGVVEDPRLPGGTCPDILISLQSDTECRGYWIILDAAEFHECELSEAQPATPPLPAQGE